MKTANSHHQPFVPGALFLLFMFAITAPGQSSGGNFQMTQSVVANGGNRSDAGVFSVTGTAGQSAAGTLMEQGDFSHTSGFWSGAATPAQSIVAVNDVSSGFGGRVNLKASVTANGVNLSGKVVSFALNGNALGTATTGADGVAGLDNVSLSGINAGTYAGAITVQFAGDSGFALSTGAGQLTVSKVDPQTLSVVGGSFAYDGQPHSANAAVRGINDEMLGPVSFLYNDSSAVPINAGSYSVIASFAGDQNYNPVTNNSQRIVINKADQTIGFSALANKTFNDPDFPLSGTASSGAEVSFSATGSCSISGNTVHLSGAGSCTVTASQSGDVNHNPAGDVSRSFNIGKADQTITFTPPANKTFTDPDFELSATASSGSPVSFAASGSCAMSGNTIHLSGAGVCTLTASQRGDANYNAAPDVNQSFSVAKANQSITFAALPNRTFGDADFNLNPAASSGLAVSLVVTGLCALNDTTLHILSAGSCTLTASQAGDANYSAAADVTRTFNIAKATTNTTVTGSLDAPALGQSETLTATVTSNAGTPTGSIQFKIDGVSYGPLLTLTGGLAQMTTSSMPSGTHAVTADYSGDFNFAISSGTLGQRVDNRAFISLSNPNYTVNENAGSVTITVNRSGDLSVPVTVDYATDDTGSAMVCSASNGLDSARCDFGLTLGTLKFAVNETQKSFVIPITQDAYTEGSETFTVNLSNLAGNGAAFANAASATVTINDSASPTANAIDDTETFVRQQYRDFLNRDADPSGLAFWKQNIDKCNDPAEREPGQTLAQCLEVQRILTSAAFFLSIEFRQTGGLVRDFYVAALDRPATSNTPNFIEFTRDTQAAQAGLVVGQGNWQETLKQKRDAFIQDFVMRAEFVGLYPTNDTPNQYVDKLYTHAGIVPGAVERTAAVAEFGGSTSAADSGARSRALLRITQNANFQARELNHSFVQLEYFGYLRRNPNDAPDGNFAGFDFWVNKLGQFNGDFLQAEMVRSFLSSIEYRQRFGP